MNKRAESDTKELIIKIVIWIGFFVVVFFALSIVLKKLGVL